MYRHIFHSKLPTKSSFVEKKRPKVGPTLSRKFQITYKIIICGEKNSQNWYYIIQKIIERSMELSTGLPARWIPFSIRVTSCRYELVVIFTCRLCIDFVMSNQHVESFCEYSDNQYFRQSITALSAPAAPLPILQADTVFPLTSNIVSFFVMKCFFLSYVLCKIILKVCLKRDNFI